MKSSIIAVTLLFVQIMTPAVAPKDIFEAISQGNEAAVKDFVTKDKNVLESLGEPVGNFLFKSDPPGKGPSLTSIPTLGLWSKENPYKTDDEPKLLLPPLFYALLNKEETIEDIQKRVSIAIYLIEAGAPLYWVDKRKDLLKSYQQIDLSIHHSALSFIFYPNNRLEIGSPEVANLILMLVKAILEKDNSSEQKTPWVEDDTNKERIWEIPVIFLMLANAYQMGGGSHKHYDPILDYFIQKDPTQKDATFLHLEMLTSGIKKGTRFDLLIFALKLSSTGSPVSGFFGSRKLFHTNVTQGVTFDAGIDLFNWLLKNKIDPFRAIPFDQHFPNYFSANFKDPKEPLKEEYTYWLKAAEVVTTPQGSVLQGLIKRVLKKIEEAYPDAAQRYATVLNTKNSDGSYAFLSLGTNPFFDPVFQLAYDHIDAEFLKAAGIVKKTKKEPLPISQDLQALAESLRGLLNYNKNPQEQQN